MKVSFRNDPLHNLFSQVRVDREKGILYGVRVIEVGEAKGHGVLIDEKSLQTITELGRGGQIKSRFGHPGMSSQALGTYLGDFHNLKLSGSMVVGDLHLNKNVASQTPNGNLYEYMLNLAEHAPHQAGSSIVAHADVVWKGADGLEYGFDNKPKDVAFDKPFLRPLQLDAVDIVDEPAATSSLFSSDVLFNPSLIESRDSALSEKMFAQIDAWLGNVGVTPSKAQEFLQRYFAQRGVNQTVFNVPPSGETLKEVAMSVLGDIAPEIPADAGVELEQTVEYGYELLANAVIANDTRLQELEVELSTTLQALAELQGEVAQLRQQVEAEPTVTVGFSTAASGARLPTAQAEKLAKIARPKSLGDVAQSVPAKPEIAKFERAVPKVPGGKAANPLTLLKVAMGKADTVEVL
jgi:hypothetical protein